MLVARENQSGSLGLEEMREAVDAYFARRQGLGRRILLLVPDNTRSGPVGPLFQLIYACIRDQVAAVDVLIALGTHPALSEKQMRARLAISSAQRNTTYASVRLFNHQWRDEHRLSLLGVITQEEICRLSDGLLSEDVNVTLNRRALEYDEIFIVGPVFPHEVVGFSGGHKYFFPGIAGAEITNLFHWLGALITNLRVNGNKWTAPRSVVERAAALVPVPRTLFATVNVCEQLKGLFIGDVLAAWGKAADLSAKVHILYKQRAFHTVVGIAPRSYDDLWTAGKVMYKLEPVVADGGTLIIYAPHIHEISHTHGRTLDTIGYHTRDYFLAQMDKFRHIPRGVLAHATHVKGVGTFIDSVERPRIDVILATGITAERCRGVNLGYLSPKSLDIAEYEHREDDGILVVPNAGEILYRLAQVRPARTPDKPNCATSKEEACRDRG